MTSHPVGSAGHYVPAKGLTFCMAICLQLEGWLVGSDHRAVSFPAVHLYGGNSRRRAHLV